METAEWERLMGEIVEQAREVDGSFGDLPPGAGTEGDDPLGLRYINLGPLAFVLNEAVDALITRGADRDSVVEAVAQAAGEGVDEATVEAVLSGENKCPGYPVLAAFGSVTTVDLEIILDAAKRGGCKDIGPTTVPPGY